jgi:hypothetical protein
MIRNCARAGMAPDETIAEFLAGCRSAPPFRPRAGYLQHPVLPVHFELYLGFHFNPSGFFFDLSNERILLRGMPLKTLQMPLQFLFPVNERCR